MSGRTGLLICRFDVTTPWGKRGRFRWWFREDRRGLRAIYGDSQGKRQHIRAVLHVGQVLTSIPGFEFLEVFEGAVDGEAGSVEAVLEAGEGLIAVLEGLSGFEVGVRPVSFPGGEFPEVGIGAVEAAKGPLAKDEVVEKEASLRGSGAVVMVILGFEPIEGLRVFPGEDFGLGVDTGLEVGGDDAGLTFLGGGAAGFPAVEAGGGDLLYA